MTEHANGPEEPRGIVLRDPEFYQPFFSPWIRPGFGEFSPILQALRPPNGTLFTTLGDMSLSILFDLAKTYSACHSGCYVECGVWKGGSAFVVSQATKGCSWPEHLHLLDTFSGIPNVDAEKDVHEVGDFADTSIESVQQRLGDDRVACHAGDVSNLVGQIRCLVRFAHVDVDTYNATLDSLRGLWPKMLRGGTVLCDDYGQPRCPGAREAIDQFAAITRIHPIRLASGQALLIKTS